MDIDIVLRHMVAGFLWVGEDWTVRRSNQRAQTLVRRPAEELDGKLIWDCIPDLRGSSAEEALMLARAGTTERRFEHFSPSLYNWFDFWAVPVKGELYVFFVDATDRARAMQSDAVRESLRKVLMDAPIAVSITRGAEHRFELMNTASRALVGGRNLEGRTLRAALPEVDPTLFSMLDSVFETGEALTLKDLEITYDRLGDGVLYTGTFDATYQPVRESDGSISGVLSISVETTGYSSRPDVASPAQ